ncbi:MAG: helix-turn-helix transcriptional regulator [Solirubrobacteraceae bacterium]
MPESWQDPHLLALGRAVRRVREQKRMSGDELASAVEVTRRCIDALEAGRLDPTFDLLLDIADALDSAASALILLAEGLRSSVR